MGGQKVRGLCIKVALLVITITVSASAQSPYWTNFTDSRMTITAVDTVGTDIWVGTVDGLIIFDPASGADTVALDSLHVYDITHLPGGPVWVSATGGLWVYSGATWTLLDPNNSILPANFVTSVTSSPASGLWLICTDVLLNYPGSGPVDSLIAFDPSTELGATSMSDLAAGAGDTVWISSYTGLIRFADSTWTRWADTNSAIPAMNLAALDVDPSGTVWIAANEGLVQWDGVDWQIYSPWDSVGLASGSPWTVYADNDGTVWMGYDRTGLIWYDGVTWNQRAVSPNAPDDLVLDVLKDDGGSVWVATARDGLLEIGPVSDEVHAFGLAGRVLSIAPVTGDSIWFGTRRGLCIWNGSHWTTYNETNSGLPDNVVWDIAFDAAGNAWLATDAGLARFTGSSWIVFDSSNSDLNTGWPVSTVAIDSNQHLWANIAAFYNFVTQQWTFGGVVRYDGLTWTKFTPDNSGIPARPILTIEPDPAGVWVGTSIGGVGYYDGLIWTVYDTLNSPLPGNSVAEIDIDGTNVVWFGTESGASGDGLAFFDGSIWGIFNTGNSPLTSNRIMGLAVDAQNDVWVGTLGAINKWDGLNWTPVDTSGGLSFTYPNKMTFAPDGDLWVATTYAGLFRLDPAIATDIPLGPDDLLPESFTLSQNFPNPFNPTTTIEYSLSVQTDVTLTVYNLLGRRVTTLVDAEQAAGDYRVEWDGTAYSGEPVATGVYFYRLETSSGMQSRKMLLLK